MVKCKENKYRHTFTRGLIGVMSSVKKFNDGGYMSKGVKVRATYSVVTPMFLSGADQSQPELRVSSIRGALRFWWRALAWSRLRGNLKALRDKESQLFGSTCRQGMLMRLVGEPKLGTPKMLKAKAAFAFNGNQKRDGLIFLSYGALEQNGTVVHGVYQSPSVFEIECLMRKEQADLRQDLVKALVALGTFGGLGAKSRNGFGSLNIESISYGEVNDHQNIEKEACDRVGELLRGCAHDATPSYSAFSGFSLDGCPCQVVDLDIDENEPAEAINSVGSTLKHFLYTVEARRKEDTALFGLPRAGLSDARRAAPIHYHVYERGGRYRVLATVFPAAWLSAADGGGKAKAWSVLQRFIETFPNREVLYSASEATHG